MACFRDSFYIRFPHRCPQSKFPTDELYVDNNSEANQSSREQNKVRATSIVVKKTHVPLSINEIREEL
jgi:hypothetical protein